MGLDSKGMMSAFRFHSTSPSISSRLFPSIMKDGVDPFSVEGIDNYPYATPDLKFTYQIHDTGVQVGYWRGVSHNLNAVALECMIDECAEAAGQDPIDYRLAQLDMTDTKHQWAGLSAVRLLVLEWLTFLNKLRRKLSLVRECLRVKVKVLQLWKDIILLQLLLLK